LDAKLLYWTGALLNMGAVVGLVVTGARQAKAGELASHRRRMLAAGALVMAFLASYVLKVIFLGREDFATWSPTAVWTLRFHECCVLVMVVAGTFGVYWGQQLRATRRFSLSQSDPEAPIALVRRHRRAGSTVLWGAILGFLSACLVLAGMASRAAL
jgi:uncharacterized membrane protein YozB (DUF420 family)